jgi:molecular chaperone GrpE
MSPDYDSTKNEKTSQEPDLNDSGSIDEFLKQLAAREKDLDISLSQTIVEIEDYDIQIEPDDELAQLEKLLETYQPTINQPTKPFSPPIAQNALFPNNSKTFSDLEAEIQKLNSEISQIKNERQEIADTMRRRSTDFENFRNRTERERAEIFRSVLSNLSNKILPVIDNLERALYSASNHGTENSADFQQFINGIALINHQFAAVLEDMGVQPIVAVGQPFDPHFHEAVATVPTDRVPHNTIVEELLRGYKIDDRIIRPSMVKVSSFTAPQPILSSDTPLELE